MKFVFIFSVIATCLILCLSSISADDTDGVYGNYKGGWAVYKSLGSAIFQCHFIDGIYGSYCQNHDIIYKYNDGKVMVEEGYYEAESDSITITITKSDLPERIDERFTVTWWKHGYDKIVFTNVRELTFNCAETDTLLFERAMVSVKNPSWGEVKSLYK